MRISQTLRHTIAALSIIAAVIPAYAVTDREMEQAKTITAQAYLRYANDGSGYLDDVKATTMSELEGKLKAKEKENIKAFNSVKIPSDYASWDKAKLIEFWSVTFFTSPNLAEKGKQARSRVKSRISSMTVSEGAPAPEPKPEKPVEDAKPETSVREEAQPAEESLPTAGQAIEKQEDILADQNAIAEDAAAREVKRDNGNTVWYVIALVLLIGCVVGLVVFAVKVMKKQTSALEAEGYGAPQGGSDVNKKIMSALKTSENDNRQLQETCRRLSEENARLKKECDRLELELEKIRLYQPAHKPEPKAAPRETVQEKAAPAPAAAPAAARQSAKMPNTIYLGRANTKGLFVRADRKPVEGSSVFVLDTRDGLVGTYHVLAIPEVVDMVLSHPVEYLSGGCIAKDIEDTDNATSIVTENSGTAIFENGCWKVLRKSKIRYE